MIKTCQICGKQFEGCAKKTTCSPECSKELKRISDKKLYKAKSKLIIRDPITCPICGKSFIPRFGRKTCSPECRKEADRRYFAELHRKKVAAKANQVEPVKPVAKVKLRGTCVICGQSFVPQRSTQKTCSKRCSEELNRRRALENLHKKMAVRHKHLEQYKTCIICGKSFVPQRITQKTCSLECSKENARRITYNYGKEVAAKRRQNLTCVVCGKTFTPHHKCKTCSPECSKELHRIRSKECKRNPGLTTPTVRMTDYTCQNCGKTFHQTFPNERFCSDTCRGQFFFDSPLILPRLYTVFDSAATLPRFSP